MQTLTVDKDDLEYVYFIRQLIDAEMLEGAALGVAKQAVTQGPDSLSPPQTGALEIGMRSYIRKKCESCANSIPWSEMFQAIDSGRCLGCITK